MLPLCFFAYKLGDKQQRLDCISNLCFMFPNSLSEGGTMPPVLELKGITKRFPGVLANDHIDLDVECRFCTYLTG